MTTRRRFIELLPAAGALCIVTRQVHAQGEMVKETDPQAVALGYVSDATRADKAKYPKYAAGEECANCQPYQGKPGAASGPCPLYAGKQVAAKGWCSAYTKKA